MRENVEQNNYKYGNFSGPELHYQFISLERLLRLYNFVKGKKRESRMNFTEAIIAMSWGNLSQPEGTVDYTLHKK